MVVNADIIRLDHLPLGWGRKAAVEADRRVRFTSFAHHITEEKEVLRLEGLGAAEVFPPGSPVDAEVECVRNRFAEREKGPDRLFESVAGNRRSRIRGGEP